MQSSISISSIISLFAAMAVLAVIPGASALAVAARSASSGLIHGVFMTLGIVAGDIGYVLLALYGLSRVAELMGSHFVLVKYAGGAYLIWLGIRLWRTQAQPQSVGSGMDSTRRSSFLSGLLITLADQKAMLFYLGFFPAFVDLSMITSTDTVLIVLIATVTVGGAKLAYALIAARSAALFGSAGARQGINRVAGAVMFCVGAFLVATA